VPEGKSRGGFNEKAVIEVVTSSTGNCTVLRNVHSAFVSDALLSHSGTCIVFITAMLQTLNNAAFVVFSL